MTTAETLPRVGTRRSPGSWSRIVAIAKRNYLVQRRNPGHWFLLLVLPLVDALLFASIGVAFGEGDAPVQLLVTGILLFHLIWQLTLAGSMGMLEEVWTRNVLNLMVTPLTEREFMGSLGLVGLIRTVISTAVIAAVGLGFYAVSPDSAGWVLVPSAIILLVFGWVITLFVVGLTLQYGDSAEVFSWGTLVLLMPLSGFFYPVESLPPVLQPIAEVIPLTRVFEAVQTGLATGTIDWVSLAWAAGGTLVLLGLSTWFLDFQLRRFRRLGWVTKFT